jgi:hypothetical protein
VLKLEINADTPFVFVILESCPKSMAAFNSLGVCCVTEENMNSTVGELCRQNHADTQSFIESLEAYIEETGR